MMSETVDNVADQVAASTINGSVDEDSLGSGKVDKSDENGISTCANDGSEQINCDEKEAETDKDFTVEGGERTNSQVEGKFRFKKGSFYFVTTIFLHRWSSSKTDRSAANGSSDTK